MGKGESKKVLVIRSAQTEWDEAGRVQGGVDLPMCAAGARRVQDDIVQLGLDGAVGGHQRLAQVICAPDEASRETGRMLVESTGARLMVIPELREMGLGLWEGMLYDDLERRFCRAGRLFLEDPRGITAPEGEALAEFAQRLDKTLAKVMKKVRIGTSAALVLRPIALGLTRCTLYRVDLCQMWAMVTDRPAAEWHELSKNDPRLLEGSSGTGRSRREPAAA